MADFLQVIQRAIDGLVDNTPEMRIRVYERARTAVERQLQSMRPRPASDVIVRQIEKLNEAIVLIDAQYDASVGINDVQKPVGTPEFHLEQIPSEIPGPTFEETENGKLRFAKGASLNPAEKAQIAGIRQVIMEAVDDLIAASAKSNSHTQLSRIAKQYRQALKGEDGELSVDLTFAYGVRLENTHAEISKRIEGGDYPDGSAEVEEAVRSVLALHKSIIAATERGQELLRHTPEYDLPSATDALKANLAEVALSLKQSNEILEPQDAETLVEIIEQSQTGPNPARSNQVAISSISNLVKTLARHIGSAVQMGAESFVGDVVKDTARMGVMFAAPWVPVATQFFISEAHTLTALAAQIGQDLGWLPPFIEWLKMGPTSRGGTRRAVPGNQAGNAET